jgi:hypothetical protein
VPIHSLGLFRERTQVQLQHVCRDGGFCDLYDGLGRISLDGHDLAKRDACLGGLHGSYIVGTTST